MPPPRVLVPAELLVPWSTGKGSGRSNQHVDFIKYEREQNTHPLRSSSLSLSLFHQLDTPESSFREKRRHEILERTSAKQNTKRELARDHCEGPGNDKSERRVSNQGAEGRTHNAKRKMTTAYEPCPLRSVSLCTAHPVPTPAMVAPSSPTTSVLWRMSASGGIETQARTFS